MVMSDAGPAALARGASSVAAAAAGRTHWRARSLAPTCAAPRRPPAGAVHPAKAAVQQQSEFAKKASQIGLAIHKTSLKLQKLAQLAKRTSMFDDPSAEIDELTGIIKHDIQGLNDSIADLQVRARAPAPAAPARWCRPRPSVFAGGFLPHPRQRAAGAPFRCPSAWP
jgi:hypothetical protein